MNTKYKNLSTNFFFLRPVSHAFLGHLGPVILHPFPLFLQQFTGHSPVARVWGICGHHLWFGGTKPGELNMIKYTYVVYCTVCYILAVYFFWRKNILLTNTFCLLHNYYCSWNMLSFCTYWQKIRRWRILLLCIKHKVRFTRFVKYL